jgi:HAD superfamily hydrolase (TIGR01549 family)
MSKIKAIIFDYDGVIAESVNVKTEAFAEMYRPYGEDVVKKVIAHHEANGGISRFEKFKIYHQEFLGEEINQEKVDELAKQFSSLVLQKVVDSPYVRGAEEFLHHYYEKYDFYISTGTPTQEIEEILKRKGIRKYFKKVYGSPEKKTSHVQKILREKNYDNNEVVFIGDALTDRDAANENGVAFIGRYTTTELIKKEKQLIKTFNDFVSTARKHDRNVYSELCDTFNGYNFITK